MAKSERNDTKSNFAKKWDSKSFMSIESVLNIFSIY